MPVLFHHSLVKKVRKIRVLLIERDRESSVDVYCVIGATIRKIQQDYSVLIYILRPSLRVYLNCEDAQQLQTAKAEIKSIIDTWKSGNVEVKGKRLVV